MTADDLAKLVVRRLKGVSGLIVTAAEASDFRGHLSDAVRNWARLTRCVRNVRSTFDTVDGQADYQLTGGGWTMDMVKVRRVWIGTRMLAEHGQGAAEFAPKGMDWLSAPTRKGAPLVWAMVGEDTMRLGPTPDGVYTVTVEGHRVHPVLASGSTALLIPVAQERLVADYCAAWLLRESGIQGGRESVLELEAEATALQLAQELREAAPSGRGRYLNRGRSLT